MKGLFLFEIFLCSLVYGGNSMNDGLTSIQQNLTPQLDTIRVESEVDVIREETLKILDEEVGLGQFSTLQ